MAQLVISGLHEPVGLKGCGTSHIPLCLWRQLVGQRKGQ